MRNVKFSPLFTNTRRARTWSLNRLLRIFGLAAATMLLALLLHLVLFHLLTARDAPPRKDTEYKIRHIDTCPDVGYFFKRDTDQNSLEPGACYLCFCQGDNTAVCWKRDNRRCNKESFHYHGVGKRDARIRRSPGFADIFFRDASRDIFDKNVKAQCKPFESSFSDDCPPADWCIGCTVCDCDANGRWDCHILSFCPDEKNKKKSKRKGSIRKIVGKKPIKHNHKSSSSSPPKKTLPNPVKNNKTVNKAKNKTIPIKREGSKAPPQKRIVKKSVPLRMDITPEPRKRKAPIRYKRIPPSKPEQTKEMIIKKNIATHKPIEIKSTKVNLEMEIAKKLMKKVMANLRKSVKAEVEDMSKIAKQNAENIKKMKNAKKPGPKPKGKQKSKQVNKRQVKKPNKKPPQKKPKPKKPIKKPIYKPKGKPTRRPAAKQYSRQKRDVQTAADIYTLTTVQGNSAEFSNTTAALSIIPMTSNLLVPDDDNCSHTAVRSSTLPENEYYKYVVGLEDPKVNMDEPIGDKGTTQVNITETVFNLIGSPVPTIVSTQESYTKRHKVNTTINITDLYPEANELKFSKWSHLKRLKEKKMNSSTDKHKSIVKLIAHTNKTLVLEDHKNRIRGKSVERKINSRKYNIVKLLNLPKSKANNCLNENSSTIQKATKNIADLQSILTNILKDMHRNSTTLPPKRKRKFSVLRYLKRIFNKIFKRNKAPDRFSKHQLIETLCENFGPCQVSRKDKTLLNGKLADLDIETTKILKTVKIIKGLLKLVDLPKNNESDNSKQENFRNDIQKLNSILKGSYTKNNQAVLTATQLTQIEYIKKNTQDFIKSVSKFASLLNEIIALLTKQDTTISKTTEVRNDFINKNMTKEDPFQSLRNLLIRYNLVQNSFMKRMYEQLNNFENKINEKPKVSEIKDVNNSVAIENFSRNIIQNLRKLKRLAQTVSFSGRTKRDTARDDDAIEYLLMLMEYLIKQNHPLDAAPVNDGIDLLIEAIKNAPDIKPIKKKVLEYTPATYADTTTIPTFRAVTTEGTFIQEEESPSESEKSSSEDSGRIKLEDTEGKLEENKDVVEMVADEEKDPEDKYHYDRQAGPEKMDEITEMAFYNRIDENMVQERENVYETTTSMPAEIELGDKLDSQDDVNAEKTLAIEHNIVDKPIADADTSDKKFEVFAGDMDEEAISPGTVTLTEADVPTTVTTEFSTQAKKSRAKMRHLNLESYDSESIDKKSKLEWIEENFGRENEKEFTEFEEHNTTSAVTVTHKTTVPQTTEKIDVSSLTREIVDETEKNKKKNKINAEEVMLRKQMDLLNSLDYGTEKGEVYESDSKDGNHEERYSSDTFPSYFV